MSTYTHKWIGSYPQVSKKKMMWLKSCGKQHLSDSSVKKVCGDREDRNFTDIFNIMSVMSLWRNSVAQQAPCATPQQNKIGAEVDALSLRTRTGTTIPSPILNANAPSYFGDQLIYRSKVTSLCVSSRQTLNLLKPTNFPVNPSEGRINELGISKDFGNDFCTIFKEDTNTIKASNFPGHLQQDCKHQARKLGECETVQTSMKKRQRNIESLSINVKTLQNSDLIVLGILPLLSSVIELKNLLELMVSQVHAIKKLISYAIAFRVFLVRAFLKKCEYLRLQGHLKVNKASTCESSDKKSKNIKNLTLNISSVSAASIVLSEMALNEQMQWDWRMGPGGMEEDEEQDDMNYREVPQVPNFHLHHHHQSGGNSEDDGLWDENYMDEQPEEVFNRVPVAPQLADEFANEVIVDHDFMAGFADPGLAIPADIPLPDEDQLIEDILDLLDHAADPA